MNTLTLTQSETLLCASIAHTLNELWRKAHGEYAQGAWDTLTPERQDRAINGVGKCLELYNAGHTNVAEMSSLMHDNWVAYMQATAGCMGRCKTKPSKRTRAWCRWTNCRTSKSTKTPSSLRRSIW